MSFIELRNVVKSYDDVTAVDGVALDIQEGEFVTILGPSGSGKTTTLELLAGFETPDTGEIRIDGTDVVDLPPEDRNTSLVFQDLALFPHMTVAENIAFGLRMRTTLDSDAIRDRVADVLELVELPGYEDRNVQHLSGGEQQRVALARAIVVQPRLLLYDEPLSDLDRQLRENMRHEIGALHDELQITSIYVTHNQREALTLGDRIAVMREGTIVQFDTPARIYTDPADEFVANFVGDANLLEGKVVEADGRRWFRNEEFTLALDAESPTTAAAAASVDGGGIDIASSESTTRQRTLLVRPEALTLTSDTPTDQSVACRVETVDHLESVTEYTVRTEGGTSLLVTALGVPDFEVGDQTRVRCDDYDLLPEPGDPPTRSHE